MSAGLAIAGLFWGAVVLGGTIGMIRYSNSPGSSGQAPKAWPADSHIICDNKRPTLLMFVHPHCPCSRASLGELDALLARCPGKFGAHVVFLKPPGTSTNWEKTDLWRAAASIPGVDVLTDNDGSEARRFQAETSGQTVLYDQKGSLQFQGGITLARGHAGDNPGRDALQEFVRQGYASRLATPVYGCSLFDTNCTKGDVVCQP